MTRANLYFLGLVVSSLRVRLDLIYFMCDPSIRMSNFHTVGIIRTNKNRYSPRITDLYIYE